MAHSINRDWFEAFFQSGGFLRKGNGETYLWQGPWQNNASKSNSSVARSANLIGYQNFFSSQYDAYFSNSKCQLFNAIDLQKLLSQHIASDESHLHTKQFSKPNKEHFTESFRTIQGKIQRQEIEKAVPCVFMHSEHRPTNADQIYWLKNLLAAKEGLYAYGFWTEKFGMMGASPEILFERQENLIHSMALAGTMLRSQETNPQALLKSTKDRHEHQVVVDDLEKQLGKLGWVKKGETKVIELPTLFHLKTEFEVEISNKTDEELIQLLHPTPALGVHPRAFGYHWLDQLPEQKDRAAFGAPLLFQYGPKQSTCVVAIRNIQWGPQGSKIGAGCGIVEESQLESEWTEIQNKLASIFQLLGMK